MAVWPGIKTRVEYNGKVILFFADIDGICWINDDATVFEDGSPVTTEDLMEFLRYYGKNMVNPKNLVFFDGNPERGNGSYGDAIRTDKDGNPLVTIKDGKIISTYVMCSCEEKYQYGKNKLTVRSQEEYDAKRKQLVSSGDFIEIRQGKPSKEGIIRSIKGVINWCLSMPFRLHRGYIHLRSRLKRRLKNLLRNCLLSESKCLYHQESH